MEQVRIAMEKQDNPALLFLLNEMIGYFRVTSKFQLGNQIAVQILNILNMCGLEDTIDGATSYINIATFYRAQENIRKRWNSIKKQKRFIIITYLQMMNCIVPFIII